MITCRTASNIHFTVTHEKEIVISQQGVGRVIVPVDQVAEFFSAITTTVERSRQPRGFGFGYGARKSRAKAPV